MTRGSVQEYVLAIRSRYLQANRGEKGKILGEFCQATGYHRKAAVRLLRRPPVASQVPRQGRPVRYGAPVRVALFVAWEALDRPCGKRLQPFLPELVAQLERHGELVVDADVRGLLGMVTGQMPASACGDGRRATCR